MSRISRVNQDRLSNIYVHRNTAVSGIKSVNQVDPVKPVINSTAYAAPNTLINIHHFYEQLALLKKQYSQYYHSERELGKALEEIVESDFEEIKEQIKLLIHQYNAALENLQRLEARIGGNNSCNILKAVAEFKEHLLNIGIAIDDKGRLGINDKVLEAKLNESLENLSFLFEPESGFINKVYRKFREIKIEKSNGKFIEFNAQYSHGAIIDKQG